MKDLAVQAMYKELEETKDLLGKCARVIQELIEQNKTLREALLMLVEQVERLDDEEDG